MQKNKIVTEKKLTKLLKKDIMENIAKEEDDLLDSIETDIYVQELYKGWENES